MTKKKKKLTHFLIKRNWTPTQNFCRLQIHPATIFYIFSKTWLKNLKFYIFSTQNKLSNKSMEPKTQLKTLRTRTFQDLNFSLNRKNPNENHIDFSTGDWNFPSFSRHDSWEIFTLSEAQIKNHFLFTSQISFQMSATISSPSTRVGWIYQFLLCPYHKHE